MELNAFSTVRLPRIIFGEDSHKQLPSLVAAYGRQILLVTGATSFCATPYWPQLRDALETAGLQWNNVIIDGEPSPQQVDQIVAQFHQTGINSVLAIGGGSVLDAAKAIAGLLPQGNSVMDYLEGVGGGLDYQGPAIPFIAVPTTAGTGSEATMNAVLSKQGRNGFKKSFRHPDLVAEIAVVDPLLLTSCPPALIAANGMDAFTQLLESYLSCRANPGLGGRRQRDSPARPCRYRLWRTDFRHYPGAGGPGVCAWFGITPWRLFPHSSRRCMRHISCRSH